MKILIAEDDANIRRGLVELLEEEGYRVFAAADGEAALALFERERPDLLCLDIMMPKRNGYDVCRDVRKADARVPVIFISAKSEEVDKVLGLELGADDFIVKPFGVKEVLARIRAVTRRTLAAQAAQAAGGGAQPARFVLRDLEVFPAELRARRGQQTIELSLRDMQILELLHEKAGQVLSRNAIFNRCWGVDHFPNSRSLDQHVSQLRKRIERDPKNPEIIRTVHGAGYRYDG